MKEFYQHITFSHLNMNLMNKKLFFSPFDGVGDLISLNGMVRYLCEKYDEVHFVIYQDQSSTLKKLFSDLPNLIVCRNFSQINIEPEDDFVNLQIWNQERRDYSEYSNYYDRYNKIGKKFNLPINEIDDDCYIRIKNNSSLTEKSKKVLFNNSDAFYVSMGIPKEYRTEKFHYERNYDEENKFFEQLNLPDEYVVLGDNSKNVINKSLIGDKDLYVVNVSNISNNIFNTIKIIENAKEVHLIENAISLITYHLQYKNLMKKVPINLHTYSRTESPRICTSLSESNAFLDMYLNPKLNTFNFVEK